MDDELHLQLEKESACVLQSVLIQNDHITGLSLNFLFSGLPKTNPPFSFTSGLVFSFLKEYKNMKCKNSFKFATVVWQIAYYPGSDSALQKIYVLSLEICIIHRPPKSCTLKRLRRDFSSLVIYEIISVSNIFGIPYC